LVAVLSQPTCLPQTRVFSSVSANLDIEQSVALVDYLRKGGLVGADETPRLSNLHGGVSNRTVLVERSNGDAWVLKQALAKLRVQADWFSDPRRIHREALGLRWLARLAPAGAIPPLLFEDTEHHLLAMQAVRQPHKNWKTLLLSGGLDLGHVRQFGELLGTIHRRSYELREALSVEFADRSFFESLRLEPYYRYTATRHPAAREFFEHLITDTLAIRVSVVQGDYSPKNILIHHGRLVLLDHEVIHFGDPAFDIGFSLTHLLSKAHHLAAQRTPLVDAAQVYWQTYAATAGKPVTRTDFERRAVRHTLGCLLARVDGRSPLEYLSDAARERQRRIVLDLMPHCPEGIPALIDSFARHLE
jgi:tRNA A-37 threonylcarbamoyl transferase component Bud32